MNGYTANELIKIRAILIEEATHGNTITYTDLAARAGLAWNYKNPNDRKVIGHLLGEISHQEYGCGRPMLTAIVVRKGQGVPGPGFWGFEGFPDTPEFCSTERRRVHDYWAWR